MTEHARVDVANLAALASALKLADIVSDAYADPRGVVERAALQSTHLFSLWRDEACSAFMFGRVHLTSAGAMAYLGPAGARLAHRGAGIQRKLFACFQDSIPSQTAPYAWGITASPIMLRAWRSFFPVSWPRNDHEMPTDSDLETTLRVVAPELWGTFDLPPSDDGPFVRRGAFPSRAYTEAELARLAAASRASAWPATIEAKRGDRLLLLARR